METYDLFSYKDQGGEMYSKFRPEYPECLYEKLISLCKGKQNYLDIAAGTGQLFLRLAEHFTGVKVANDLSSVQLQALQDSLKDTTDVKVVCCDALEIKNHLPDQKYDIITIGEAFHWFDSDRMINYIKSELLNEGGIVILIGYFYMGIKYTTDNEEFNERGLQHSIKYIDTIQQGCTYIERTKFLMDLYKSFDFGKHFSSTQFSEWVESRKINRQGHEGYLRTWSFFPIYIEKNKDRSDFKDPLIILHESIVADLGTDDYAVDILQKFFYYILK
jgi:SAM-dependent methyltransferase